ncbi:aminotransferase class I/II-fold pyridoxal phosphate-dependent enzyme [Neisseria leonii]|uniref:Putative 8-amino-7-oxononanoate synthase n=1 Tax=Neisseria leonii TaxID=2995413 RepID=A0A9X4IDK7_9NEIS|nr:aminotransferase class I/II-fold pyridoxal phosphate-dependent enzyme [Neisseria sp. 51.81]MDD9327312.1 aminotransferase class I/II-fold pyridoxal phosphate-dependent enzyme [Neisseria sp. 51.81]
MRQLNIKEANAVNIARAIEEKIRNKLWPAGYRLPTVRELAETLNVNPNTVSAAYTQLRHAGIITTDGRRGSFVQPEQDAASAETLIPPGLTDLASGNIDRNLLPELNPRLLDGFTLHTDVGNPDEHHALRRFIREWLSQTVHIDQDFMLLSGSLDIMERALQQRCIPGAKVMVENPCWPPLLALLSHLRLNVVALGLDNEGSTVPDPAQLDGIAAVILTARAHSPTGINYSLPRWQAWQRALSRSHALLIVDDHWATLSQQPFHGMQGFDNEWIYSTSTSKFLGTDARIAIAAGNGMTLQAMKKRFALGPRWISKLLQHMTLGLWQQLGESGLRDMGDSYLNRRKILINYLKKHDISVPGETGEGLHIWLPVPDAAQAVQFLAARGWAVYDHSRYCLPPRPSIRITVSRLTAENCPVLAADIAEALKSGTSRVY